MWIRSGYYNNTAGDFSLIVVSNFVHDVHDPAMVYQSWQVGTWVA